LDCGDGVTHCVPVYEGYSLAHAIGRIDLGGRDITNHLQLLLRRSGHIFYTSAELELVRQIKEKVCHVSTVYSKEDDLFEDASKNVTSVTVAYNLPDGQAIKIGPEKFRAPEVLFTPERIGIEYPGV
jgi:centractin